MGKVDALIVTTRDGALHRDLAVPFLESGTPVWVDKPLASTVPDAEEIVAAAARGGTAVTARRCAGSMTPVRSRRRSHRSETCDGNRETCGPASPYSGIFFYGIHSADVAQRLVPGPAESIDVHDTGGAIVVRYRVGNVLVSLELIRPDDTGRVPFRATAVGSHGVVSRDIRLGEGYVEPGVDAFARMPRQAPHPAGTADRSHPRAGADAAVWLAPCRMEAHVVPSPLPRWSSRSRRRSTWRSFPR